MNKKNKVVVKKLVASIKLRKGAHQNDLRYVAPKEDPTDRNVLLNYFKKRLEEIESAEKALERK